MPLQLLHASVSTWFSLRQKNFQGKQSIGPRELNILNLSTLERFSMLIRKLRYHIGESMLPSMRHFLKFIDAYDKWDAHGFNIKVRDGSGELFKSLRGEERSKCQHSFR